MPWMLGQVWRMEVAVRGFELGSSRWGAGAGPCFDDTCTDTIWQQSGVVPHSGVDCEYAKQCGWCQAADKMEQTKNP